MTSIDRRSLLRAGLAGVRELVDGVRRNAKALTRTIGR